MTSPRILAVDWSGAVKGAAKKIWLAEATSDGVVVRVESGRTRAALATHLVVEAQHTPNLLVGLDFAFSLPMWFLRSRGLDSAPALWELAEREGEEWLRDCNPPFWGRRGRKRPELPEHFRGADRDVPAVAGITPKSVFQINGGGAVGTGSIRGMPILRQLRDAGFAVWPFDARRLPMLVEIYPRILTGAVSKASKSERERYLSERYPALAADVVVKASGSDDAFDAVVSALVMAREIRDLDGFAMERAEGARMEGAIWLPKGR